MFMLKCCSIRELMTPPRRYSCGVFFERLFVLKFDANFYLTLWHQPDGYKVCFDSVLLKNWPGTYFECDCRELNQNTGLHRLKVVDIVWTCNFEAVGNKAGSHIGSNLTGLWIRRIGCLYGLGGLGA